MLFEFRFGLEVSHKSILIIKDIELSALKYPK